MDAGMRYYLYKDIKELQFKVKTLKEDNQVLNKRIKVLEKILLKQPLPEEMGE